MNNALKHLRLLYRKVFKRDLYNVGLVEAPIHRFLDPDFRPVIHWLPKLSRRGAFIADPFGVETGGRKYLLCEYFDYRDRMARILSAEITDTAHIDELRDAIVLDSHISYPFLLEHQGQVFCIPETSRNGEVSLYIMDESPHEWKKERVLLENVSAVDPSIVHFGGYWWLFYGLRGQGASNLYVSYADNLHGPWRPHAKQPVKTDMASSRSGGTPFVHEGKLYRPAQDCSKVYGGRVVINEVEVLSPSDFAEKTVAAVEPSKTGPYPDGLHTLSAMGSMTLLDGKREQFIACAVSRSMKVFLKRLFMITKEGDL
jgi:hypothetical protein